MTITSLSLFLTACSAQSAISSGIGSSTGQPTFPAKTPELSSGSKGFLNYYLFPRKSTLTISLNIHPGNQIDRPETNSMSTDQVSGTICLGHNDLSQVILEPVTVDLRTLSLADPKLDEILHNKVLETTYYPTATFVTEKIEGLPAKYQEGKTIPLHVSGELTIRDITRPVTFDVLVKKAGGKITGTASTSLSMSDFGLGQVVLPGDLSVEDQVQLNLVFSAMPVVE